MMTLKFRILGMMVFFAGVSAGAYLAGSSSRSPPAAKESASTHVTVDSNAPNVVDHQWDRFALLLIDVQRDFWNAEAALTRPDFPDNVRDLLAICRNEGIEVIHIRSEFDSTRTDWPESFKTIFSNGIPCTRGTAGAKPTYFAVEQSGERIFFKQNFNGFQNADLLTYLRSRGTKYIFIAGLTTDVCVLSTAFGAVNNGFLVTLVEDCCAAPYSESHEYVLRRYGDFLFNIVTHDQVVEGVQASKQGGWPSL